MDVQIAEFRALQLLAVVPVQALAFDWFCGKASQLMEVERSEKMQRERTARGGKSDGDAGRGCKTLYIWGNFLSKQLSDEVKPVSILGKLYLTAYQ